MFNNMNQKTAGAVLLEEEPYLLEKVGWKATCQGFGSLVNLRGYAMLRIVLWKIQDGEKIFLYDQPIIAENPGAVVVIQDDLGRVAMVQNYRMVGPRLAGLENTGPEYIRRLEQEGLWEELVESLGQWKWESPRGLSSALGQDLNEQVLNTAYAEALEEAGLRLRDAQIKGPVNANSTFFPHAQYVVWGRLESVSQAQPENLEVIGPMKFFTLEQLAEMNRAGNFDDGMTLAAMAICGLALPQV